MDPSAYKTHRTSRGLIYSYFRVQATSGKPTLLLLHGFPSTSYDWRHVVPYFQERGYGLIVPDMLGFGGTDKPTDPAVYRLKLISSDLVDILDHEGVQKAILIGHDFGAITAGRLANYFPERFLSIAFLALSYSPPGIILDPQAINRHSKETLGYELFGYWYFMSEEGSAKLIEDHFDSFQSLVWPNDYKLPTTDFAPLGACKTWLLADKRATLASFLTADEAKTMKEHLLKGGFEAPLCWYKVLTRGLNTEDDKAIPEERQRLPMPTFFGGCEKDLISLVGPAKKTFEKYTVNGTVKVYDTDHWLMLSHGEELSKDLEAWIAGF